MTGSRRQQRGSVHFPSTQTWVVFYCCDLRAPSLPSNTTPLTRPRNRQSNGEPSRSYLRASDTPNSYIFAQNDPLMPNRVYTAQASAVFSSKA